MSTQEEWIQQQLELYQGSGSGTLAEQEQRGQVADAFEAYLAGQTDPQAPIRLNELPPIITAPQEERVLTDFNSFAPTNGSSSSIEAIFRSIGGIVGALGAPAVGAGITSLASQLPPIIGAPPVSGGVTIRSYGIEAKALACTVKRRRYKIVRNSDGTISAEAYCLPRRMNPLNPRALARAGRRVASFSRIAQGMQKMLERSCRVGARKSRRAPSFSTRCATSRCK